MIPNRLVEELSEPIDIGSWFEVFHIAMVEKRRPLSKEGLGRKDKGSVAEVDGKSIGRAVDACEVHVGQTVEQNHQDVVHQGRKGRELPRQINKDLAVSGWRETDRVENEW